MIYADFRINQIKKGAVLFMMDDSVIIVYMLCECNKHTNWSQHLIPEHLEISSSSGPNRKQPRKRWDVEFCWVTRSIKPLERGRCVSFSKGCASGGSYARRCQEGQQRGTLSGSSAGFGDPGLLLCLYVPSLKTLSPLSVFKTNDRRWNN